MVARPTAGSLVLAAAILLAGLALSAQQPAKGLVRIAAAADLRFALDEIARVFRLRSPDARVDITYGSSGTFHAQILQGAPFDLFLSADMSYPRDLIAKGRGSATNSFVYAIGRIVLWVPSSSPLDLRRGMDVLRDPRIRHVAIANPVHAPYGRAAEASMRTLGVWAAVSGKLVLGENIAQAAQFVDAGAAEIGIVARSLALSPAMKARGRYWDIPVDAYPVMEQGGLILSSAVDVEDAARFRAFMRSSEAQAILTRFGFVLPG